MRKLWCYLALILLGGCTPKTPENVILIVIDTLRADHLGFYGYERPTSPRLDEWSHHGVVFDQALATSPWTLPTFGSILSGRIPSHHGAGERAGEPGKRWRRAPLRKSVPTLPEVLSAQGWRTGAVVSNPFLREHFGLSRGFEIYDYERDRTADEAVDRSIGLLDELAGQPFFLMVHLIDPHLPYQAPEPHRGTFSEGEPSMAPGESRKQIRANLGELSTVDHSHIIGRYDEEIAFVDQEIGRFLDQLEQRGLFEHSLVILTADHGEELFDHGDFEHGHTMHQELLRVPLVMWESGLEPRREEAPFSLADLSQTVFAATQGKMSPSLHGISHWEALRRTRPRPGQQIVAENTLWSHEQKVMIEWPFKLVLHEKSGQRQIFDLATDPQEENDLAAANQQLADRLEQDLRNRLAEIEPDMGRESMIITEEAEQELRSLGYLD
jgi:arylsulfatase A-like enzyme